MAVHGGDASVFSEFVERSHSSEAFADEDNIIWFNAIESNGIEGSFSRGIRVELFVAKSINPLKRPEASIDVTERNNEFVIGAIKTKRGDIFQLEIRVITKSRVRMFKENASMFRCNNLFFFEESASILQGSVK